MRGAPATLGVVGAGTMGAGIAQLGCAAGMRTLLHDPLPEALEGGAESVRRREPEAAAALLETVAELDGLASCDLVIEAAPERVDLKRSLFERLSQVCSEDAVLATNTSSIPVTSLASASARPESVVGMHFFNPAPVMKLLELIAADQTGERALAVARAAGEAMGKHVIVAADGPGFLVNRCARPFYTEALRLLQERVAPAEQIDRVCRLGGGFRMGPFELMDLVGIDVGLEVARSFDELSFGEPRWRPNPIQARMVAAGRLGRKTGRGYYDYSVEPYRPQDPDAPPMDPAEVPGHPVLGRIVCQLVNEAAFAIGEGVGSAEDIDAGLELGLNHPRGPVAWSEAIGLPEVLRAVDALWEDRHEERYRAAPLLRRRVAEGRGLRG